MIRITSYVSADSFPDIVINAQTLVGAALPDHNFHRYFFEALDMTGCSLRSFKGRGVIFKDSILRSVDLTSANLVNARLINCLLDGATLRKANLLGARIRGSSFTGADLTEANLHGADFSEAKLEGATLTGARYSSDTKWPADFRPSDHGAVLTEDE
ncbi:MAG: pentapeptide repeat-containing protein [Armatimonadota bacterium]